MRHSCITAVLLLFAASCPNTASAARGTARTSPLFPFNDTTIDRKANKKKKKDKDPCQGKSKKKSTLPRDCFETIAPTDSPTPAPLVTITCPQQDPTLFNRETSLPYFGRPQLLKQTEITALEEIFMETYNLVVADCTNGSFRTLENVQIIPPNDVGNSTINIPYPFPLVHRVSFSCRGCNTNETFLFSVDETNISDVAFGSQRYLESVHNFLIDTTQEFVAKSTLNDEENSQVFSFVPDDGVGVVEGSFRNLQESRGTNEPSSLAQTITPIVEIEACPECPGPSSAYFVGNYSALLQGKINDGNISAIESLGGEPLELQNITCNTTLDEFESIVFVDFLLGNTTEAPTAEEVSALEETFQISYNSLNRLNSETCDPQFREVLQVRLEGQDVPYSRRDLQLSTADDIGCGNSSVATNRCNITHTPARLQLPVAFLFRVRGRCRGCKTDRNLFDQGSRRRSLESIPVPLLSQSNDHRALQFFPPSNPNNTDDCVCVIDPPEFRAPTRSEFTAVYNRTVTSLVEEGEVDFVQAVEEVAEVEEVPCPEETSFTTQIVVGFEGFPARLDEDEEADLQDLFVFSFNEVSQEVCDEKFRKLESVAVLQLLDEFENPINRTAVGNPETNVRFTIVFEVFGRCRDCPPDLNLFDDAGVRRLALQDGRTHGHMPRRMEEGNDCFCDIEFRDNRPPTDDEFIQEFTKNARLNLDSIEDALLVEAGPTATPTLTPTTSAPSALNVEVFEALFEMPFNLDNRTFSSGAEFPIYVLDSRPNAPGDYAGNRSSDGAPFTLQVAEITLGWAMLQEQGNTTGLSGREADYVNCTIIGLTNAPVSLGALVVTAIDDAGNITSVQMVPIVDPSTQLSARRALAIDVAGKPLLVGHWIARNLQSGRCVNYIDDAFSSYRCFGEGEGVNVDQGCVLDSRSSYRNGIASVRNDYDELEEFRSSELRTILIGRLLETAVGLVRCGSSVDCLLEEHTEAVRRETTLRQALTVDITERAAAIDVQEGSVCDRVEGKISDCFSCGVCPEEVDDTECCSNDDCVADGFCVAGTCLRDGTPRFTLEWRGDDDLSLRVVTPGGISISADNPVDESTGGQWEQGLRTQGLGLYAESIYFSSSLRVPESLSQTGLAPNGIYTVSVTGQQDGLTLDAWVLTMYVDGVAQEPPRRGMGGTVEDLEFDFVRPTDVPSTVPSSFPTDSLMPSIGPTGGPSAIPTWLPSINPSNAPSGPTGAPSQLPSSSSPTVVASGVPSGTPSASSDGPSQSSDFPTSVPSVQDSSQPSVVPSFRRPAVHRAGRLKGHLCCRLKGHPLDHPIFRRPYHPIVQAFPTLRLPLQPLHLLLRPLWQVTFHH